MGICVYVGGHVCMCVSRWACAYVCVCGWMGEWLGGNVTHQLDCYMFIVVQILP